MFSRLPFVFGQALSLHTKHTDYISFKLPHLSSCTNRLPDFFDSNITYHSLGKRTCNSSSAPSRLQPVGLIIMLWKLKIPSWATFTDHPLLVLKAMINIFSLPNVCCYFIRMQFVHSYLLRAAIKFFAVRYSNVTLQWLHISSKEKLFYMPFAELFSSIFVCWS
jgi:hypothetical protein